MHTPRANLSGTFADLTDTRKGEKTHRSNFPLRNKLMALLSDATVVMEASDTSGTLHQAARMHQVGAMAIYCQVRSR